MNFSKYMFNPLKYEKCRLEINFKLHVIKKKSAMPTIFSQQILYCKLLLVLICINHLNYFFLRL